MVWFPEGLPLPPTDGRCSARPAGGGAAQPGPEGAGDGREKEAGLVLPSPKINHRDLVEETVSQLLPAGGDREAGMRWVGGKWEGPRESGRDWWGGKQRDMETHRDEDKDGDWGEVGQGQGRI